jgi:hypothetical protein
MSVRHDCHKLDVVIDHGWGTAFCGSEEICSCPEDCDGFETAEQFLMGVQDRLHHEGRDAIAVARGAADGE